jgi:Ca-activated chloride channel family protein
VSFQSPLWLLSLLLVPVLVVLWVWYDRRRRRRGADFAAPALQPNLVARRPGRLRYVVLALLLLALSTMLVGVARPHAKVNVKREEATIVVAIDVSDSMRAKDVQPTRLVAARRAARAFANDVPDKFRVGLVSFAGPSDPGRSRRPSTAPRSSRGLQALRPAAGTALGDAIRLSVDLARRSGSRRTSRRPPPS